ncbi:Ribophorin I, partial [Chytriomyces sp. MP71]
GYVAYSVSLNEPLAAGATAVLEIAIVYTQLVRPYPAVVSQNDEQYLLLALNAYIDSPYETAKQKTTIKMPTAVTMGNELIGPEPISKKGFTVTYGPYADIKPFQSSPLYLHYKDKNAILVVKSLSREMEISHWGSNLGVTEYYDLHNKGAALRDKLFSRIDFSFARYTRGSTTNVVEELKVILPPKTSNLYYRDEIGNVSTSHFRKSAYHESILEIKPRYPLYGGWRYSWHHTYDVPLNDYLKVDRRTGRHVLQVKFMGSLSNVTIEHSRLKVALPEGAQNVKIALPFEADFQTIDQYWTNLDTVGRPLVIIEKKNVADEYAVPVQV